MTSALDDFRSKVFWSSAKTVSLLVRTHGLLGKSEISNTNITLSIKQHVFRLEIPIDNIVLVQLSNSINDFSRVNPSSFLREALLLHKVGEQLSSIQEVNDEVKLSFSLESKMETHDVWILYFFENISFGYFK